MTDMKSVIQARAKEESKPKDPAQSDLGVLTDNSSVMSSASAILDSISSIFTIRQ